MSTISDILLAQGNESARARERMGALWGNLVQYAGNIPREAIAEQQQQRDLDQQRALRAVQMQGAQQGLQAGALELQQKQAALDREKALANIWSQPGIYDPKTNQIDLNAAATAAQQAGHPELVPMFAEINQKGQAAQLDMHVKAATAAKDLAQAGKDTADTAGLPLKQATEQLKETPIGAPIAPQTFAADVKVGIPTARFDYGGGVQPNMRGTEQPVPLMRNGQSAPLPPMVTNAGTPEQQLAAQKESREAATAASAVSSAQTDERYRDILRRMAGLAPGDRPVSKDEFNWAQAYKTQKTLGAVTTYNLNAGNKNDARLDNSYKVTQAQLSALEKPVLDRAEKLGDLETLINQRTPQADALVAPKLLTVMVGGQGSGLRMNEAEISRIVGGRSNFESLKAALNKWQLDPTKALSITDAQRKQMQDLASQITTRVRGQRQLLQQAQQKLIDAPDVQTHRQILADVEKGLGDLAMPDVSGGAGAGAGLTYEDYLRSKGDQ